MTAAIKSQRTGHWADTPIAANEPRYPTYPQIKTKADVAQSVFVWIGGTFFGMGLIALVAYLIKQLTS